MNACGVEISDGWAVWAVVGGTGCLLLMALTGIAVWADQHYQRRGYNQRETLRRATWRAPEDRDEEAE